uniref:Secreted protein n=1 Tax=Palpitomonas bilix TaxID=652834 RepID=A0A7S3FZB0_9EUKA|mmetsp:Transcript_12818/g.33897  ORF Transcript_12818/g.33897 Transcript_12818/m.33897 type:complete len:116 (+) Transcript_12818:1100-1447(+)
MASPFSLAHLAAPLVLQCCAAIPCLPPPLLTLTHHSRRDASQICPQNRTKLHSNTSGNKQQSAATFNLLASLSSLFLEKFDAGCLIMQCYTTILVRSSVRLLSVESIAVLQQSKK